MTNIKTTQKKHLHNNVLIRVNHFSYIDGWFGWLNLMSFFQTFKSQLRSLNDLTELIAEGNPCRGLVQDLEMVNLPRKIFKT